ncbi:FKBP-type peptidyl-prolyl cis-trans isomerase [Aliiglaciecola lipolytica]|uniref:Peptidyl-prolyl cis-trans isomerase n=1 Tax=Aliiglaciecola lipolytica E3 TaxID=1127673 RepID=K6XXV9_9ALTE|nr:FKBP-type peptidyl-prolyl cis-trans isomerase [Aliiglaciecola lipolytica]GAC16491.1 outer membrane protein MIP [Aliiglaciecola lipolytica E3]
MGKQKQKKTAKGSTGHNKNLTADFINKYQGRADVSATGSGLLYTIIDMSDGQKPQIPNIVRVNQRILLADGSVIDDTYKTGIPEEFSLEEAIEGLREGIQLMPVGSRFEFVIPPELAWGKKGNRSKIGPNTVMIVDVRLISFE